MQQQEPATPNASPNRKASAGSYLASTVKHGGIYTLGVILSRAISFVMIPVYTRALSPTDYGILEVLGLTADIVSMLGGLGIGVALVRLYHEAGDEAAQHRLIGTALQLLIGMFFALALVGGVLAGPLAKVLLGDASQAGLVQLTMLNMAIGATFEVPGAVLRARQESSTLVVIGLVRLLIGLAFNVIFLVWLEAGVAGVLTSSIIASTAVSAILARRVIRETGVRWSARVARRLIAFGAPLVVWSVGSFVLHFSDRFFLRTWSTMAEVGLYSLAYKIAMLLPMFVSSPFDNVWLPKALEIERNEGEAAVGILVDIQSWYNLVLVSCGVVLALFGGDVIRLMTGSQFHSAGRAVPVLALGMVFFGYRNMTQIGALIRGRSDYVARSTATAAVTALALNALLIPRWGMMGAAVATVMAFQVEFLLMRSLSQRAYALPIPLGRTLFPVLAGCLAWGLASVARPAGSTLVASFGAGVLAFAAYALVVFRFLMDGTQRGLVMQALRQPTVTLARLRG